MVMVWHPDCGYVDVFEGFGGVLVEPDFFDDAAFDIPPVFWAADDPWLSGCLARRDIPIWAEILIKRRGVDATGYDDVDALTFAVIDGHGRRDAYRAVIGHFREHHGVWC